jgi:hypothetical protein
MTELYRIGKYIVYTYPCNYRGKPTLGKIIKIDKTAGFAIYLVKSGKEIHSVFHHSIEQELPSPVPPTDFASGLRSCPLTVASYYSLYRNWRLRVGRAFPRTGASAFKICINDVAMVYHACPIHFDHFYGEQAAPTIQRRVQKNRVDLSNKCLSCCFYPVRGSEEFIRRGRTFIIHTSLV